MGSVANILTPIGLIASAFSKPKTPSYPTQSTQLGELFNPDQPPNPPPTGIWQSPLPTVNIEMTPARYTPPTLGEFTPASTPIMDPGLWKRALTPEPGLLPAASAAKIEPISPIQPNTTVEAAKIGGSTLLPRTMFDPDLWKRALTPESGLLPAASAAKIAALNVPSGPIDINKVVSDISALNLPGVGMEQARADVGKRALEAAEAALAQLGRLAGTQEAAPTLPAGLRESILGPGMRANLGAIAAREAEMRSSLVERGMSIEEASRVASDWAASQRGAAQLQLEAEAAPQLMRQAQESALATVGAAMGMVPTDLTKINPMELAQLQTTREQFAASLAAQRAMRQAELETQAQNLTAQNAWDIESQLRSNALALAQLQAQLQSQQGMFGAGQDFERAMRQAELEQQASLATREGSLDWAKFLTGLQATQATRQAELNTQAQNLTAQNAWDIESQLRQSALALAQLQYGAGVDWTKQLNEINLSRLLAGYEGQREAGLTNVGYQQAANAAAYEAAMQQLAWLQEMYGQQELAAMQAAGLNRLFNYGRENELYEAFMRLGGLYPLRY